MKNRRLCLWRLGDGPQGGTKWSCSLESLSGKTEYVRVVGKEDVGFKDPLVKMARKIGKKNFRSLPLYSVGTPNKVKRLIKQCRKTI